MSSRNLQGALARKSPSFERFFVKLKGYDKMLTPCFDIQDFPLGVKM